MTPERIDSTQPDTQDRDTDLDATETHRGTEAQTHAAHAEAQRHTETRRHTQPVVAPNVAPRQRETEDGLLMGLEKFPRFIKYALQSDGTARAGALRLTQ